MNLGRQTLADWYDVPNGEKGMSIDIKQALALADYLKRDGKDIDAACIRSLLDDIEEQANRIVSLEARLAQNGNLQADIEERDRRIDKLDGSCKHFIAQLAQAREALQKIVERRDMHGYTSTNKRLDDMQAIAKSAIAEAVTAHESDAERKLAEIDTHCEALLMSVNSYEAEAKLARRILAIVRNEETNKSQAREALAVLAGRDATTKEIIDAVQIALAQAGEPIK